MNKSNTMIASKKGMSTLARPKFAPGMLLQHEDLEQLNYYTRDLSRLMFRSLFGCGVMCGLVVTTDVDCGKLKINIGSGVALSCSGDPIEVPSDVPVLLDRDCHPEIGESLWVTLCGTVKCCAPRTSMCESDDDETKSECTRERDGYEIRVESTRPPCVCGCPEPDTETGNNPTGETPNQAEAGTIEARLTRDANAIDCKCADPTSPCYEDHYAGHCGCHCDDCDDCQCKCILLARLDFDTTKEKWVTDHSVRRFVRPVLMRDPQVEIELAEKKEAEGEGGGGGAKPGPPPPPPPPPVPVPVPLSEQPEPAEEKEDPSAGKAGSKATKTSKKGESGSSTT